MSRRKPRHIRPEEIELWSKVVEHAVPLYRKRPLMAEKQSLTLPKPPFSPVPRFRLGETAKPPLPVHDLLPPIQERLAHQPVAMDRKRFSKMKKGRLSPEARIDLHGMTTAQAHPALTRFIVDAVSDGRRLVLVITGKGRIKGDDGPIPERHGVLRHQVPHWLHSAPLKAHVMQVSDAHVKHGGQGAYYVYLRRNRQ